VSRLVRRVWSRKRNLLSSGQSVTTSVRRDAAHWPKLDSPKLVSRGQRLMLTNARLTASGGKMIYMCVRVHAYV
jgi:hypothetical protein